LILIAGLCGMCYGGASKPPKNPSTLSATAVSSTQIDLVWTDNATDEDGFRVERMIGTNGTWETLDYTPPYTAGSGKGCCMYYSDVTCDPDTEYCYRIFAFNQYGDSTPSNVDCDTTFASGGPPEAPTNLVATAVSSSQINLAWTDNSTNETGFKIEVDEGDTGTFLYLDTVGADVTSYPDTGLSVGVTYCYRVYAYNGEGDSDYSNVDCDVPFAQPPAAPTNLVATAVSETEIDLEWDDNSDNELGFKIEVDEGNTGTFVYLDTVGANVTSYPDSGLTTGVEYCYRVYAYNGDGDSGYSNVSCDTPVGQPPAAPSNLDAVAASASEIDLTWTDNSSNEDAFVIEVDEGNTGSFVYLDTVGADVTSYPDAGLTEGVEYCYRVYATNTYGDSAYSNVDCATPQSGQVVEVSNYQELLAAAQAATPGTIIELLDGVYDVTNTDGIMLTDKTDVTFRSKSGNREAVIVQGEGISDRDVWFIFKFYNCHYMTVQDMTMKDVYWHHFQLNEGCNYFTVQNCVMWDAGEGPIKTTVADCANPNYYSDFGLVEDCVIGYTTGGKRTVVEGIDLIASADWVITNTEFYRAKKQGGQVGYGFFVKANGADTVVENCYFEDCDIPLSFGNGQSPSSIARYCQDNPETLRGIMRNNVVHGTQDVGIYLNKASDFKVYNNTVWSTYSGGSSIDFRYPETYGECFNNIFSQGNRFRDGGTATLSNNLWNAPASLFVDQANGDYHLVSTATAAIDQGLDTSADVPYDMDWESRPKGSDVDIGADEF